MKIGIIGCGNMGGALLDGIITGKIIPPRNILVADARREAVAAAKKKYGIHIADNRTLARRSEVIILAVKPGHIAEVIAEIADLLTPDKTILSIAAGITTRRIETLLPGKKIPVIRLMPNLPAKVKKGIIAFCPGRYAGGRGRIAETLFSPVGKTFKIPENMMDAITAVSGSGPGFIFHFAEIIHAICRKKGFSEKISHLLARHVFEGAGAMLAASEEHPRKLKEMVSSPGGTTLAGLSVFARRKLDKIFEEAVNAAEKRSRELSIERK